MKKKRRIPRITGQDTVGFVESGEQLDRCGLLIFGEPVYHDRLLGEVLTIHPLGRVYGRRRLRVLASPREWNAAPKDVRIH